jgi:hypothetical protein
VAEWHCSLLALAPAPTSPPPAPNNPTLNPHLLWHLQTLDTAALVITLANIALQLLAMVWLLLQTVKLAHVKALVRAPRKAARGVTRLIKSATMRRSLSKSKSGSHWGKFQPALELAETNDAPGW